MYVSFLELEDITSQASSPSIFSPVNKLCYILWYVYVVRMIFIKLYSYIAII